MRRHLQRGMLLQRPEDRSPQPVEEKEERRQQQQQEEMIRRVPLPEVPQRKRETQEPIQLPRRVPNSGWKWKEELLPAVLQGHADSRPGMWTDPRDEGETTHTQRQPQ